MRMLPKGAAPRRVGFVSDIHIGPTTPRRLLENALSQLAESQLDVLLLGGDYVFLDANRDTCDRLASLVRAVPAAQKFAVLGNHDLWTHHRLVEQALKDAGVVILNNESAVLDANDAVALVGLDEPWTGTIDATSAMRNVAPHHSLIVLCHSPDGLPHTLNALNALGPSPGVPRTLYMCGHTHGGHIATPWGPLIIPGRVGKKYPHGFHHVGPIDVFVSRGVGGIELPIRTYAPPEVAIFDLVSIS